MADNYPLQARERVRQVFNDFRNEGVPELSLDEFYVVWFSKTLQHWKALVSTTLPDGVYYEVTYNGDNKETYVDIYFKQINLVIDSANVDPNQIPLELDAPAEIVLDLLETENNPTV